MKHILRAIVVVASFLVIGCTPSSYMRYERERVEPDSTMMSKRNVVELTKAGVSDSVITTMIDATGSFFLLKPSDVVDLKNAGVSDAVINKMLKADDEAKRESASEERYASRPYRYWNAFSPFWYASYYSPWHYPYPTFAFRYSHGYRWHPWYSHRYVAPRHWGWRGGNSWIRGGHYGGGGRATIGGGGRSRGGRGR